MHRLNPVVGPPKPRGETVEAARNELASHSRISLDSTKRIDPRPLLQGGLEGPWIAGVRGIEFSSQLIARS
jgi:hypothetical protein